MFKDNEGEPIVLTDKQCEIFSLIFLKKYSRNHLMTYTQYGKSFTVALGILARVAIAAEKWIIVAGREKQAKIIMQYIIQHAFDNEFISSQLDFEGESMERLQRERSKSRLTFRHPDGTLGEVMVLSADSRNKQTAGESVMGFGAANVVLDEAALIDDDVEAKIFRMLGAQKDNFYFKIGNPFRRNHFYKDFINPDFHKISVNWITGVVEGRLHPSFVEEARRKPSFDVLYDNKFPPADVIDDQGYIPLLTDQDLHLIDDCEFTSNKRLGIDPAGEGLDETVFVVRDHFRAKVVFSEGSSTPRSIAQKALTIMEEYKIDSADVFVDNFGSGANISQYLAAAGKFVNAINVGESADDKERYLNLRAESFWRIKEWLRTGGELIYNDGWQELLNIKYRAEDSGKLKIMGKDEMRRRGIGSPGKADALMLTFVTSDTYYPEEKENIIFNKYSVV